MTEQTKALEIYNINFSWKNSLDFFLKIKKLSIKKGERVILLGESGCGKSTLLNLINGVLSPNQGRILVDQIDITSLKNREKDYFRASNIGVIFQKFNLLNYLSPINNILLPCFFTGFKSKKINYYKDRAIDLGIKLNLSKKVLFQSNSKYLSVGQQQRIAIIRALILKPKLVLADEPTSALDISNKNYFMRLLLEFCDNEETTLVMVSHDDSLSKYFDKKVFFQDIIEKV